MPPHPCELCHKTKAQILRPKNHARLCAPCFTALFEAEIAETITSARLFQPGERIAIGASGGKDSTVLASVLKTLNDRHGWNLELILLSIDEGITGYRDHSLDAVRRNAHELGLKLKILSYEELYGWSMDQVVAQIGRKGNCTYCGVFRRQALDRGAARLGVRHVVTGHNVDDVAETVVMNLLRGDLARLSRGTSLVTSTPGAMAKEGGGEEFTRVKRSKPLMFAYEKEIVLYAHHKRLVYFSTECVYSPEAFRGSARTLIKSLERIRPESVLDVVRSGMDMARLVPGAEGGDSVEITGAAAREAEEEVVGGCGSDKHGSDGAGEMARMEAQLQQNGRAEEEEEEEGNETEIKLPVRGIDGHGRSPQVKKITNNITPASPSPSTSSSLHANGYTLPLHGKSEKRPTRSTAKEVPQQKLGQCERCGYLSSQAICKACVLLEGLNKARPKTEVQVGEG